MSFTGKETKSIIFESKEKWLDYRLGEVTSTEVSALFGLNPYISMQKLHVLKKERIIEELDGFHLVIGSVLERSIAKLFMIQTGKKIRRKREYISCPELKIGSSFDYVGEDSEGKFLVEIKNVSSFSFSEKWKADGDEIKKAPKHIELQMQNQMLLSGIDTCYICCLVGGNTLYIGKRKFDKKIGDEILKKVNNFWENIDKSIYDLEPSSEDICFLLENNIEDSRSVIDIDIDSDMEFLIHEYKIITDQISALKSSLEDVKSYILCMTGGPAVIKSKETRVGEISYIQGRKGTLVTNDMVGTTINQSKGYIKFKIFI